MRSLLKSILAQDIVIVAGHKKTLTDQSITIGEG